MRLVLGVLHATWGLGLAILVLDIGFIFMRLEDAGTMARHWNTATHTTQTTQHKTAITRSVD